MDSRAVIICVFFNILAVRVMISRAQDNEETGKKEAEKIDCDGIYLTYTFISRTKEYPYLKNVTTQPWAFKSAATITNAGLYPLKNWKIFIGFQNDELLVSATNAIITDAPSSGLEWDDSLWLPSDGFEDIRRDSQSFDSDSG